MYKSLQFRGGLGIHNFLSHFISSTTLSMSSLFTPPPTPTGKPIIDLPTKLRRVHTRLLESGTYLGTGVVRESVTWAPFGKSTKLVLTDSFNDVDSAATLPTPSSGQADEADSVASTPPSTPTSTPSDSNQAADPTANPPADTALPEIAVLSAVVKIRDDDFYLTSDGGYRGPGQSSFIKCLAEVKPSCNGGRPDAEPFNADFSTTMANLRWLLEQTATDGFEKRGVILDNGDRMRVRHILFEVSLFIHQSSFVQLDRNSTYKSCTEKARNGQQFRGQ
jgi:hypothetical protein